MNKIIIRTVGAISLLAVAGCGSIESGEAGFLTQWGEVISKQCLDEGLHFIPQPGRKLVTYSIRNQTVKVREPAFTRDIQTIDWCDMEVTFHLMREKVIDLHKTTGISYADTLIMPSIKDAMKNALGKMDSSDIIGNREIVAKNILDTLNQRLESYGIHIDLVNITNIDFSDPFEKAVEEKQVALQQSQKERNNTARLKEVAEQQVVKADAEARSRVLEAEADAKAILVKAEAEAKSIKMRNDALAQSRALIEYETVKTWDGKLPVQMFGNAPVPFLNLNNNKEVK